MRFNTLLLDRTAWDLILDSSGNIAMAEPPYALAQDVASAVRLFFGELWYNGGKGIPYWEEVLGHLPPMSLLTGLIEKSALGVPGVTSAQCMITSFDSREIAGEIRFLDEESVSNVIYF